MYCFVKTDGEKTKDPRARVNHTWLVGSIADRRDKTPVLERINAEALSVNGDFFFFVQDRIDQGAFTGTQPLTLYCGKKAVKVTTWREVFWYVLLRI